ncbi:class I SAM-dependent methyltransferase [Deinococcus sp. Arct2-2]|uniref:class I SAM-dependent methyltransferase n=1 Tax=Deinococcus sp. Arct2-2 TaxID=2568653 RepID=UPI0010A3C686|nr:class I SAM-dependent methyltransferase [Deinococcus sp. Arct2-2]THF68561.1 class I SAM-dependent methyltransferase [Deinococcus sp. Arct2-2]
MTGIRKQKIRVSRGSPDKPGQGAKERTSPGNAASGSSSTAKSTPAVQRYSYFDARPAALAPRLDGLHAFTKPGVRGYPEVDEAQSLMVQTMRREKVRGDVLDLTAMGGLTGSLPGVTLRAVEGSAAALAALKEAGIEARAACPGDTLSAEWPTRAQTVALVLAGDRGTAYAMAQVAWAHACTPPGGTLYIAGDRDKGFDRYVRAAGAAFGTGETIGRDGGMRVAKLIRRPGQTPPLPQPETYEAYGVQVVGLPGVFSAGRLDKATTLFLEYLTKLVDAGTLNLAGKRVLDLGCGTGIIGAWAAKHGAEVTLVDGDLSSVRSAEATLQANTLTGECIHSDVDASLGQRTFDLILTNPPFHVGRGVVLDVAREFIQTAVRRLVPGGTLYLVANEPLPYETPMQEVGPVRELLREGGFKVLVASKTV